MKVIFYTNWRSKVDGTTIIRIWYYNDEFRFVVIYGTDGVGKSSYALQSLKQVIRIIENV